MKKKKFVCMIGVFVICLVGGIFTGKFIVEKNSKTEQTISASRVSYSLSESIKEADVIAQIKIKGVNTTTKKNGIPQTIHDAVVLESYKGNLPDKLHVLQDGTLEMPFVDNPIFSEGETYLLIMKRGKLDYGIENVYWILKEYFVSDNQVIQTLPGEENTIQSEVSRNDFFELKQKNQEILEKSKELPYEVDVIDKKQLINKIKKEIE